MQTKIEEIGGGMKVSTSSAHNFGTDSLLLAHFAAPRVVSTACDLGSGCGIIPLLWLRDYDELRRVYAVDIQPQAIYQMRESIVLSGLDGKLVPVEADLRDLKGKIPLASVDLVVCNPPYNALGTGVMSKDPSDRISRHETMCTLSDCCAAAAKLLRFGGRFCLCQLPERLADVLDCLRENKLEPKRMRFVQKDVDSPPWLILVEGRRGAKPHMKAESALVMYENGATSREMREIYSRFGHVTGLR